MSKQDYYETLEVAKGATVEEIKKSYRRLAMKYHPDRNQGNAEAEAKFKEINEAYEILKDDQKRAAYDRYGHAAFEQGGGANPFDFNFGSGFGDIFSEVFSDFMGGGRRSNRASAGSDGEDLRYDLEISLEDAFNGLEKEISFPTEKVCDKCNGFGTKDGKEPPVCPTCRGSGRVHRQHGFMIMETVCPDCGGRGYVIRQQRTPFGVMQTQQPCSRCGGKGKLVKNPCKVCHGSGKVATKKTLEVSIPMGIDDDQSFALRGMGDAGTNGGPAGDVIVMVTVRPSEVFQRDGYDVWVTVPITYSQAVLGDSVTVPSIDGKVEYTVPEGTQSGTKFRLRGQGIQYLNGRGRGDQYVIVDVEIPKKVTRAQREALKAFEDSMKEDNYEKRKGFFKNLRDRFS